MYLFSKLKNQSYIFPFVFIFLFCFSLSVKASIPCDTIKKKNKNKEKPVSNEDEYYKKTFLRYEDYTYKENINTILFYKDGFELSPPLLQLGSDEELILSFDDFSDDIKSYKYTIIHCDAGWKPSDMLQMDYIDGFNDDYINTYSPSFNTLQKYYHYDLKFPSENLRPTKSGNYILKVFENDDTEENLVLTRRFMIFEQKVDVVGEVKRATSNEDMFYKQEVDFSISNPSYTISNPYIDLKVIIQQNNRWDNAVYDIKPKYVKDNKLVYDYEDINVFNGGNEFRHFDTKSIRFISDRINKVVRDSLGYEVYLLPDERRSYKVYSSETDINGLKFIKTDDAIKSSDIEAEYAYVHFVLPYYEQIAEGNIYIFGALTDWQYKKEAIMKYDKTHSAYTGTLYLKQGYYNYEYVLLNNNEKTGDETFIEGNHFDTENDYTIYVYNQEQGTSYDRLIAVKKLNSFRK
ncbi:MAG TPA: DUF5103 domain-containing protein [Bacteroidales bacterium]|nr:DUF5103 domain-containing protein [Bacteroidales bacterium]HPS17473.1 DUF5103 domain-containing protein [Bacteroidales bacterium]